MHLVAGLNKRHCENTMCVHGKRVQHPWRLYKVAKGAQKAVLASTKEIAKHKDQKSKKTRLVRETSFGRHRKREHQTTIVALLVAAAEIAKPICFLP